MRKSIFELLEEKIDYNQEVIRIWKCFQQNIEHNSYNLFELIDHNFLEWKYRNNCTSINDIMDSLELEFPNSFNYRIPNQEQYLKYCELFSNLLLIPVKLKFKLKLFSIL
ncbi:MAG: hypothetical protein EOM87_03310 [Clostridia bacterium]|nr:hypothetical protein [Clostridia bacterium]